jgi:hypothetical protein
MALPDALAVATVELQKNTPDALAANIAFFNQLNGRYKPLQGGNNTIQIPVAIIKPTTEGWISGSTDVLNINPQQNFAYGQLQYKYFANSVPVTLQDMATTYESENAILDLVEGKAAFSFNQMIRTIGESVFLSGTAGNLRFNGLADVFAAAGTAYAGLNNTDYPTWLPEIDTTTNVVSYATISRMLNKLKTVANQTPSKSPLKVRYDVDLMISNYAVQSAFVTQQQSLQRFERTDELDSGFSTVKVQGVKWMVDPYSPGSADGSTADNYLYLLSMDSFQFGVRYGFGVGPDSPLDNDQVQPNQPVRSIVKYHVGNIWCENRRPNGVFKALIA